MSPRQWFAFVFVSLTWGTTFLWYKVALEEMGPLSILLYRMGFGAIVLAVAVPILRPNWPPFGRAWLSPLALGIGNLALPQFLIVWGEQTVDSTVTSILLAATPLLTLLVAAVVLADERITVQRLLAMAVGFGGVLVLISRNWEGGGAVSTGVLAGQLAQLGAAMCFAVTSVLARAIGSGIQPMVQALIAILVAETVLGAAALLTGHVPVLPRAPITWVALIFLGAVINGVAMAQFYYLLTSVGPTRTQMVSYVVPMTAVLLGVLFLGERLHWQLLVGGGLILLGVAWFHRVSLVVPRLPAAPVAPVAPTVPGTEPRG